MKFLGSETCMMKDDKGKGCITYEQCFYAYFISTFELKVMKWLQKYQLKLFSALFSVDERASFSF